ncbi:hypothetical protein NFI96_023247 [Prochilodus magdalenae]|nr:hypothetical protein NFI96_023247 [Prochilodus magdalenae]
MASRNFVLPVKEQALRGREARIAVAEKHAATGRSTVEPFPEGTEMIMFGMGCFWGAERRFWNIPGVFSTQVGYAGGFTPNPTYQEVCSGLTGHTEVVRVVYSTEDMSLEKLLKVFWESHDPTQGSFFIISIRINITTTVISISITTTFIIITSPSLSPSTPPSPLSSPCYNHHHVIHILTYSAFLPLFLSLSLPLSSRTMLSVTVLTKIASGSYEEGMSQGNDKGTQYRSAIYTYTREQQELAMRSKHIYQQALKQKGLGEITTEIREHSVFYYAEDYHQQYLHKVPKGYCGLKGTGVTCSLSSNKDEL